jgi:hypothetical protein
VALTTDSTFSPEEKLVALRHLDQFRHWRSLDEKRYCLGCGKVIAGTDIQIVLEPEADAGLKANCPSDKCPSIPMDWVLPNDDVIARAARVILEKRAPENRKMIRKPGGRAKWLGRWATPPRDS